MGESSRGHFIQEVVNGVAVGDSLVRSAVTVFPCLGVHSQNDEFAAASIYDIIRGCIGIRRDCEKLRKMLSNNRVRRLPLPYLL